LTAEQSIRSGRGIIVGDARKTPIVFHELHSGVVVVLGSVSLSLRRIWNGSTDKNTVDVVWGRVRSGFIEGEVDKGVGV